MHTDTVKVALIDTHTHTPLPDEVSVELGLVLKLLQNVSCCGVTSEVEVQAPAPPLAVLAISTPPPIRANHPGFSGKIPENNSVSRYTLKIPDFRPRRRRRAAPR